MEPNKEHRLRKWGIIAGCFIISIIASLFWWHHETGVAREIATQAKANSPKTSITKLAIVNTTPDTALKLESPSKSVNFGQLDVSTCINMATALQDEKKSASIKEQIDLAKSVAKFEVDRLLKAAINSQNLQERATALLMKGQLLSVQAQQDFRKKHPDCDSDKICEQQAIAVAASAQFESTDRD